ncbi:hypothetical protein FC690_17735 [Bacillus cereus]|nr:hypothetical protein FC690_17735 [Bacillus cereus]
MSINYPYNNYYYPLTENERPIPPPTQNGQWFYLPQHYFKHGDHWDMRPGQNVWIDLSTTNGHQGPPPTGSGPVPGGVWFWAPAHYFEHGNHWEWRPGQYVWVIR